MKKIYKNKELCIRTDCKMAECCARAMGYRERTDEDRELLIVNPDLTTGEQDCTYLATIKVARYAKGFQKILKEIPIVALERIYAELYMHFSKNPYYKRRNGTYLCSPDEQEYIRSVFAKYGITGVEIFDGYQEQEVWEYH